MSDGKRRAAVATCLCVVLVIAGRSAHTQTRLAVEQPPSVPDSETLAKQALAEAMISQNESIQGKRFSETYRSSLKGSLVGTSGDRLASLNPFVPSFLPEVVGDSAADLVYTPVTPCRVVNFVRITPGANQNFDAITGSCGIPFPDTTAVMMNIVAVDAAGNGDLRIFPFGTAVPLASVINYGFPASGFNIANGLIVPVCNANLVACSGHDITVQADGSAVTLVIDVYGFFQAARPIQAAINADGTIAQSSNIVSVTHINTGLYEVISNRDITACSWTATLGFHTATPAPIGMIGTALRTGTTAGVSVATAASNGIPADLPFNLLVTCPKRNGI